MMQLLISIERVLVLVVYKILTKKHFKRGTQAISYIICLDIAQL